MICIRFENGKMAEAGNHEVRPEGFYKAPADFDWNRKYVLENGAVRAMTQAELDAETLMAVKSRKIADIKLKAHQAITGFCPEWKQANLLAQAVEALSGGSPTPAEIAVAWDKIKAVRAKSNDLEAAVNLATDVEAVKVVDLEVLAI